MHSGITEELYLSPPFTSREQLEEEVEFWDGTLASCIARCPRYGEYRIREDLLPTEEGVQLTAGHALHAALSTYYILGDLEAAMEELMRVWGHPVEFRLPPAHSYSHLHLGHLQIVLRNYCDFAKRRDTFKPILVDYDDLCLDRVVAAKWRITPNGRVILGESSMAITYEVNGEEFIYCGKPDLPISHGGKVLIMDHKCTNAYLSDWYFEQYRFSNALRGYCSMLSVVIPSVKPTGALINGLYIGDRAVMKEFKGTRFTRFGPLQFRPDHLEEAIRNQYHWRKALDYWEEQGYYPQNTGHACRRCDYASLCIANTKVRDNVKRTDYLRSDKEFLDL